MREPVATVVLGSAEKIARHRAHTLPGRSQPTAKANTVASGLPKLAG